MNALRKTENLHIALWLIKDTCWVMDLHLAGVLMIWPTLSLAIYITWRYRKMLSEIFHNIAVCLWITANSIWMIGEFYFDDGFRLYATLFFFTGLALMLYYYLFLFKKLNEVASDGIIDIYPDR